MESAIYVAVLSGFQQYNQIVQQMAVQLSESRRFAQGQGIRLRGRASASRTGHQTQGQGIKLSQAVTIQEAALCSL